MPHVALYRVGVLIPYLWIENPVTRPLVERGLRSAILQFRTLHSFDPLYRRTVPARGLEPRAFRSGTGCSIR